MKKTFCYILAACAVLAGCKHLEEDGSGSQQEIRFTASVGSYQVKATDSAFEEGDAIGLRALYPLNLNCRLTYDGGAFRSGSPLYWAPGQQADERAQFVAYYPYQSGGEFDQGIEFTVRPDQSTHAGYTASDFMSASTTGAPADGAVHLNFSHRFSKLILQIEDNLDEEISQVYMGEVLGSAVLTPESLTCTGSRGTIKAARVNLTAGGEAWALVTVPQQARPKLMITTVDGKQYTYTVEKNVQLLAGTCHRAHITIDGTSISTDFTSDVTKWIDDADIQFHSNPGIDSIREVLAGKDGTEYTVKGTISGISDMDYGSYSISDEKGDVLPIVGTVNDEGYHPYETQYGWYAEPFGFVPGDVVTVTGRRVSSEGLVQLANVQVKGVKRAPVGVLQSFFFVSADPDFFTVFVRAEDISKFTVSNITCDWLQYTGIEDAGMPMSSWHKLSFSVENNSQYQGRSITITLSYYGEGDTLPPTWQQGVYIAQAARQVMATIAGDIEGMNWERVMYMEALSDGTRYAPIYYEVGQSFVVIVDGERLEMDMPQATGVYEVYLDPATNNVRLVSSEDSSAWSMIGTVKGTEWDRDFVLRPTVVEVDGVHHAAFHYVLDYHAGEEFKLRHSLNWEFNFGFEDIHNMAPNVLTPLMRNGPNIAITQSGVYDVRFTFFDQQVIALPTEEEPWQDPGIDPYAPDPDPDPVLPYTGWSIIGEIEGMSWDRDIDLMPLSGDTWYGFFYYEAGQSFVLRADHQWENYLHMPENLDYIDGSATLIVGGSNIYLPATGIYELILNTSTCEVSITPMGDLWGIIGDVCNPAWETDLAMQPYVLELDGVQYATVHCVLDYPENGQFKFRYNKNWEYNYGGGNDVVMNTDTLYPLMTGGDNLSIEARGVYDVFFRFNDKKVLVRASQEEPWNH